MNPLQVLMVAAEAVPFAKAGGLGDVMGALPLALEKQGVRTTIVIPRYRGIDLEKFAFEPAAGRDAHHAVLPDSSVDVFLIGNDKYFDRDGIYFDLDTGKDYPDQADRWIFFQRAVMDFFRSRQAPDIIHCHDHQTALIPAYLRRFYRNAFPRTRSVFTIHNMGYQGLFPRQAILRAGFDDAEFYPTSPFEFYGMFNFMKVGITYSDVITTVSETYAREIQSSKEYGYGLEDLLKERSNALVGIRNGIDDELWNPAEDQLIPFVYSVSDLTGKQKDKQALFDRFGLNKNHLEWPVLAMISRIDIQKGFDLVVSVLDYLLSKDLYFVLLGSGNRETEGYLRTIIEQHRGKAGMRFEFDNGSAHLVEAGADIFLMPSKYEPCGLNQMYSLRYGTVPVVRSTGGLADTVHEYDPATGKGTGFCFKDYDPEQFRVAIDRALALWPNRKAWVNLMRNGMQQDFGWTDSAKRYVELYERLLNSEFSSPR
jgi:starch synthase